MMIKELDLLQKTTLGILVVSWVLYALSKFKSDFLCNVFTEMLGVAVTVWLVDWFYRCKKEDLRQQYSANDKERLEGSNIILQFLIRCVVVLINDKNISKSTLELPMNLENNLTVLSDFLKQWLTILPKEKPAEKYEGIVNFLEVDMLSYVNEIIDDINEIKPAPSIILKNARDDFSYAIKGLEAVLKREKYMDSNKVNAYVEKLKEAIVNLKTAIKEVDIVFFH